MSKSDFTLLRYGLASTYASTSIFYDNLMDFIPYSAGIDFSRQILTTKVDPCTVREKYF